MRFNAFEVLGIFGYAVPPVFRATSGSCLPHPQRVSVVAQAIAAIAAGILLSPSDVFAQSEDAVAKTTQEAGVGTLPENFEFLAFPIVAYTPETSVIFAGAGLFFFDISNHPDAKRSDVMLNAAYTLRGQAALQLKTSFYFGDGKTHFGAEVVMLDWPSDYFGYGGQVADKSEEFNNQQLETEFVLDYEMLPDFYAGVAYEFGYNSLRIDPDSKLFEPGVPGLDGGVLSGVGFRTKYDTRDTKFAATRGSRIAFEGTYFNNLISSDFDYWKIRFDARHFFDWNGHTLGVHGVTRLTIGDPPFYDMSTIGGDRQLRGVFRAQYLDNSMFVLQSEYRTPYLWRLGLAAFAGIGDTFQHVTELTPTDLKWGAGGGVRVLLKEKERVNLRVDVGVSAEDYGFYFGLAEAF